jgi:hypothetical protein
MRVFFLFVCAKQELRGARYEIDLRMKNVGLGGEWGMREAACGAWPGCSVWCIVCIISYVLFGSVMMMTICSGSGLAID